MSGTANPEPLTFPDFQLLAFSMTDIELALWSFVVQVGVALHGAHRIWKGRDDGDVVQNPLASLRPRLAAVYTTR